MENLPSVTFNNRIPNIILSELEQALGEKNWDLARELIKEYFLAVQEIVRGLRPEIEKKFPLTPKEAPKSPSLQAVKEDENGSIENAISFLLNEKPFKLIPFSTGTAPYSCIDNFPLKVVVNGVEVPCTFVYEGILTTSESVFAAEKIINEENLVSFFREKFGNIPFLEGKDDNDTASSREVVLSLTELSTKFAPRKLTCKNDFFTGSKLWDSKLRVWVMMKALLLKFTSNEILREILFKAVASEMSILGEIQNNNDFWTILATDDSVGLLGAVASIVALLLETNTSFEEICPIDVLEMLK